MKVSLYVPDDLHEAKAHEDMNVSAICQRALSVELEHRARLAELKDKGFERIEARDGVDRDAAF